jgi:hypothetical protein
MWREIGLTDEHELQAEMNGSSLTEPEMGKLAWNMNNTIGKAEIGMRTACSRHSFTVRDGEVRRLVLRHCRSAAVLRRGILRRALSARLGI